jgi:hypothetical protein
MVAPEKVDLVSVDPGVHLRMRQAMTTAEPTEDSLKLAACQVRLRVEVPTRDQAKIQGLANGTLMKLRWDDAMQVAEGARRLGDRDSSAAGREAGNEGGRAMDRDALSLLTAGVGWKGHVDRAMGWGNESPQCRGAPMADYCAVAES